jgi:D-alanyl-D-alanine endopeptidase (penicillin-binding protein 7)
MPAPTPTPPAPASPSIKTVSPVPHVSAKSFILGDLDTGEAYALKNADTPLPIASISKLLVALAVRETLAPTDTVTITKADRRETDGYPGTITRDEAFSVGELLYPLLMESNNSAAYAIERAGGGDEFVRVMLRIAHDVGMDETLLNDSSGLSAKNEASARDLFSLTRHIASESPDLLDITRTKAKSVTAKSGRAYAVANLNVFASDPSFLGGKTGYTDEAKQTMLAVFEVPVKGAEKPARIAIIVLGSSDRKGDINTLKSWFARSASFE